jgi:hypothetical protein
MFAEVSRVLIEAPFATALLRSVHAELVSIQEAAQLPVVTLGTLSDGQLQGEMLADAFRSRPIIVRMMWIPTSL